MTPPRALVASLALLGCGPEPGAATLPPLDTAVFEARVEPVLERRCANPSCHGNDRRPLRVYAPERFRADPARRHRAEPLTFSEVRANEASARAFALGVATARESLLVAKPLGLAGHQGGAVFETGDDAECEALVAWLRTGGLP